MIAPWPQDLSLASFERALPYNQNTIYRLVFTTFANQIQVQREEIAVPNLEKIFNATFSLSSKQSFHAMSLRDLSRETGISMGGLYNYIGSKEELAQMIEVFMDNDMVNLGLSFIEGINAVRPRLETILRVYIYMGDVFLPWYQFVYMETKSMTRKQKEVAKGMEMRDVSIIQSVIELGQEQGLVDCRLNTRLIALAALSLVQNWYLKRWRFLKDGTSADIYADFVVSACNKLIAPTEMGI
ncbi:MAG: TetR/AcrR family transcriptional regulator [Exilibacterium sp.]